jgi:hypothetical protein
VVLAVACVAVAGRLSACGGSEVVARVDGRPITRASLEHWTAIEAILTYQLRPTTPVPKGVVPDPPRYSACIEYSRAHPPPRLINTTQTTSQLKATCQQRYETLRQTALGFLISAQWLAGEGAEQGVTTTEKQIRRRIEEVRKVEFPSQREWRRHLQLVGETFADQLFRSKVKVLSEGLEQKLIYRKGTSTQSQRQALVKFAATFPRKWAARTSCQAGYVVPDCKQYKGPLPPQLKI